jgi:DNA-binding response OmpR family regulator
MEQPSAYSEPPATVLIVDDEEAIRESTAALLRAEGFEVLEASDGAAAMWTMASRSVDVLLLDLHLGRVDGTAVLDALDESSTVVVFSGFGSFEESAIRKGFGPVVFECLVKPVPPPRLIEVVTAGRWPRRSGQRPSDQGQAHHPTDGAPTCDGGAGSTDTSG